MNGSTTRTRDIVVRVESRYEASRSEPRAGQWFFIYQIEITNEGPETVQLISRHWIITDGNGEVQEVRGPGVIGQQPIIGPGESHRYASACPLETEFGTMHGTFQMTTPDGDEFDVEIAPFALSLPNAIN